VISNGKRCSLYLEIKESDRCICRLDTAYSHCKNCVMNYTMKKINEKLCTKTTEKLYCIIQCSVCGKKICPFDIYPVNINNRIYIENYERSLDNSSNDINVSHSPNNTNNNNTSNNNTAYKRKCTICYQANHKSNNCPNNIFYTPSFNSNNDVVNVTSINNKNGNINVSNVTDIKNVSDISNIEKLEENNTFVEYKEMNKIENLEILKKRKFEKNNLIDDIDAKSFFGK
jgi:hypothetical protein